MSQEEELPTLENDVPLTNCLKTLCDIFKLCQENPDRIPVAIESFTALAQGYDFSNSTDSSLPTDNSKKCTAQREIEEHVNQKRKSENPIKPTSVVYRDIAQTLSKNHEIPLDKQKKKKEDLFKWFDANWNKIQKDFFKLLDNHPNAQMKNFKP